MLLNFPLPIFPKYLLIDFSDIPALISALILGPVAGILVELVKNILDYFLTGSITGVPIGPLANFIAGCTFILPIYYIYRKFKSKKGMIMALIIATLIMSVSMSILNYYVILPAYTFFMHAPVLSAEETRQFIVASIFPFNLVKGSLITIVFMLVFSNLSGWLQKQAVQN